MTTDTKPVDAQFAGLWPPGTPGVGAAKPGHQEQPNRTLVHPAPSKPGGKRPAAQPVPKPPKRKKAKPSKSTPGGQAQPSRTKKQQGK